MELTEKIWESIRKRAESYTPEMSIDTCNMGAGSALAMAYTQMLTGTIKKLSRIVQKNRIAFYNELGAQRLPAVPSHGRVQFLLVNEEVEGTVVEAGTTVLGSDDGFPDGQAVFETCEELYVTPAQISDLYQTCDRYDSIFRLYDRKEMEWSSISLFSPDGKNLQEHEMYFAHDTLLSIEMEAYIALTCYAQGDALLMPEDVSALADPNQAEFTYYSTQGWTLFASVQTSADGLIFYKGKEQPAFQRKVIQGQENFWIRLRILHFSAFSDMGLERVRLSSWNQEVPPDIVVGAQGELNTSKFFPFGESLSLYQEIYFGSEEVLSRRGAQVTLSFHIHFVKLPLPTNHSEEMNWEWIMKQSDLKRDPEVDVTIGSVIWEYYNGSGWTRLFQDDRYFDAFSVPNEGGGQYRTVQFICPDNMELTLIGGRETYGIRARIVKINHMYRLSGQYMIPVLENTSLRYRYVGTGLLPQQCIFHNNLEYTCLEMNGFNGNSLGLPFFQTGVEEMAIYMGFEVPPIGSPIKIWFCLRSDGRCGGSPLLWEYWNGQRWRNVSLVDETNHFSETGTVSFAGNADMDRKRLFGKLRYWLRIRDVENAYGSREAVGRCPVLSRIDMNTAAVRNIHRRQREYFQIETYQEDKLFQLLENNIYEVKVYVDESEHLSAEEIAVWKQRQSEIPGQSDMPASERIWVEWDRVDDFSASGPLDRHFVIHPLEGELLFGDGRCGRIPCASRQENILVDYCSGGGEYTNLREKGISRLSRSIGYIRQVTNQDVMTGGCDAETTEETMERLAGRIRHQNKIVSVRDMEQIVLGLARDVRTVKCFVGYDDTGKKMHGAVTLVVLQKQFSQGNRYFAELRERILQYVRDKGCVPLVDNQKLFVISPKLIKIRLYIELCVENYNQVFQVKKTVLERLEQFFCLDVPGAREIGNFPDIMQIQNTIYDIPGIVWVRKMMMNGYTADASGWTEVDVDAVRTHPYILPVNGEHEIIIEVESGSRL